MKYFAYVGSMRGKKSVGYKIVNCIHEHLKSESNSFEILTANNSSMNFCEGCLNCFKTGYCPLDLKDNLNVMKDMMKWADVLIIASPVYLHQVSGNIKTLIDRLSYWTHIFQLIGKRVIVCSETSTSGNEYAISYLKKAFSGMGGYVVGEIKVDINTSPLDLNEMVEKCIENLEKSFICPNTLKSTMFQEELFYVLKSKYMKLDTHESQFWRKNGLLLYETFEELLNSKLTNGQKIQSPIEFPDKS